MADFTQDILDALAPMLYAESSGGPLTDYLTGISRPFVLVEDWVSDTDDGDIGWSLLLDPDRCPVEALPWLAQIVGLTLNTSLSEADQRQQLHDVSNWKRGTPGAIKGAPAPFLTGTKTVVLRERYDGTGNDAPYDFEVITLSSETTDPAMVLAALISQKPAGNRLTYVNSSGQDYQDIKDNFTHYSDVKAAYLTYNGIKTNTLGA